MKIGRADNIKRRIAQLKASNPYPIRLVVEIVDAGKYEKAFHEYFKDQHHIGEWFNIN